MQLTGGGGHRGRQQVAFCPPSRWGGSLSGPQGSAAGAHWGLPTSVGSTHGAPLCVSGGQRRVSRHVGVGRRSITAARRIAGWRRPYAQLWCCRVYGQAIGRLGRVLSHDGAFPALLRGLLPLDWGDEACVYPCSSVSRVYSCKAGVTPIRMPRRGTNPGPSSSSLHSPRNPRRPQPGQGSGVRPGSPRR